MELLYLAHELEAMLTGDLAVDVGIYLGGGLYDPAAGVAGLGLGRGIRLFILVHSSPPLFSVEFLFYDFANLISLATGAGFQLANMGALPIDHSSHLWISPAVAKYKAPQFYFLAVVMSGQLSEIDPLHISPIPAAWP